MNDEQLQSFRKELGVLLAKYGYVIHNDYKECADVTVPSIILEQEQEKFVKTVFIPLDADTPIYPEPA